jgi:hypothetical protein
MDGVTFFLLFPPSLPLSSSLVTSIVIFFVFLPSSFFLVGYCSGAGGRSAGTFRRRLGLEHPSNSGHAFLVFFLTFVYIARDAGRRAQCQRGAKKGVKNFGGQGGGGSSLPLLALTRLDLHVVRSVFFACFLRVACEEGWLCG